MSFDRLAPHYDRLEALTAGRKLERARAAWLECLAGCHSVLSAGEGHGRFAAAFAARFPEKPLLCIEPSSAMWERAQRRLARLIPPAANVRWEAATLPEWQPPAASFDAIVTCFFLDCFPPGQLEVVVARLAAAAPPNACWINVDFSLPARGAARWRAQAIHRVMYLFFRGATHLPARALTPPDAALRAHGFTLAARKEWEWGLLRADHWQRTVDGAEIRPSEIHGPGGPGAAEPSDSFGVNSG